MASRSRLVLTAVAPVHIGDGSTVEPWLTVHRGNRLHVLSLERVIAVVGAGLAAALAVAIHEGQRDALLRLLRQARGTDLDAVLRECTRYTLQADHPPTVAFRPFVRTAFGAPYLPGSSVKGALRTAVAYAVLKAHPAVCRRLLIDVVESRLEAAAGRRVDRRTVAPQLDAALFRPLHLGSAHQGPNTDMFRAVAVGDTPALPRDGLRLADVTVYSGGGARPGQMAVEALPVRATAELSIRIDTELLGRMARENPHAPCGLPTAAIAGYVERPVDAAAALVRDLLAHEREVLRRWPAIPGRLEFARPPALCLGWGGGLLARTLALLLPEDLRGRLRDTVFAPRPGALAPKSRRVASGFLGLGWMAVDQR